MEGWKMWRGSAGKDLSLEEDLQGLGLAWTRIAHRRVPTEHRRLCDRVVMFLLRVELADEG